MMMISICLEKRQRRKQQLLLSVKQPRKLQGPRRRRVSFF
jgi:hypothetical protein